MDTNPVRRAKEILGGTLDDLATAAGVTPQAASKWTLIGRIPLAEHAYRVWQATLAKGDEVTMPELAGFDAATPFPTGTEPEEGSGGKGPRQYAAPTRLARTDKPAAEVASLERRGKRNAWSRSRRWCTQACPSSTPSWPDSTHLPATGTDG